MAVGEAALCCRRELSPVDVKKTRPALVLCLSLCVSLALTNRVALLPVRVLSLFAGPPADDATARSATSSGLVAAPRLLSWRARHVTTTHARLRGRASRHLGRLIRPSRRIRRGVRRARVHPTLLLFVAKRLGEEGMGAAAGAPPRLLALVLLLSVAANRSLALGLDPCAESAPISRVSLSRIPSSAPCSSGTHPSRGTRRLFPALCTSARRRPPAHPSSRTPKQKKGRAIRRRAGLLAWRPRRRLGSRRRRPPSVQRHAPRGALGPRSALCRVCRARRPASSAQDDLPGRAVPRGGQPGRGGAQSDLGRSF